MNDSIRIRLSPKATTQLMKLMEVFETDSPGHCANKLINKLYKQLRLNEDTNEQDPTICQI